MGTTPPGLLVGWALSGLVLGWVLHPLGDRFLDSAPQVTWLQPIGLAAVAAVLGYAAWVTWRQVRERELLLAHQAVNRLLLARSSALVGAFVGGGYLGYALSWVGASSAAADDFLVRSLVSSAASAAIVVAALFLERACRIRVDGDPDRAG